MKAIGYFVKACRSILKAHHKALEGLIEGPAVCICGACMDAREALAVYEAECLPMVVRKVESVVLDFRRIEPPAGEESADSIIDFSAEAMVR